MEHNCDGTYLMQIFEELTFSKITEENRNEIENFLISILDSDNNNIFNNILLYNILILIKNSNNSSFLIDHLTNEVELKAIRIFYLNLMSHEEEEQEILPVFAEENFKAPKGQYIQVRSGKAISRDTIENITYLVNDKGQAVEILKRELEKKDPLKSFNASPISTLLNKNLTISENDL